jgi:hypothetical protein
MSYNVIIFASFPSTIFVDPQQELANYGSVSHYFNLQPAFQTATIVPHNVASITSLNITSNGVDDGNFDIFPIKYANEDINFVVKLKDIKGFDVKDYKLLPLSSFTFSLSSSVGANLSSASFQNNIGTLSSLTQGGFFKGLLTCPVTANNVKIKAIYNDGIINLTGSSATFSIYSSGGLYQLRKVNEDFDQANAFKYLATQPALIDRPMLMDQFLGQIVGTATANPNTLGIEVYEKISNFVSNLEDIEYCNVDALKSLLDSVNVPYENFDYDLPPSFKRLVDILSVKHKLIFGQSNQYQGNYNPKGFVNSAIYGLNRGTQLNINSAILSSGSLAQYILTHEKFSDTYNLVSTDLTGISGVPYIHDTAYPLSAVSTNWGWSLVLPGTVSGTGVSKYYDFYKYTPAVEGTLLQKFLDFDNSNNTLLQTNSTINEFTRQGGIIDNVLLHNIYTNLEILS